MSNLLKYLQGGDLRSIANANEVISLIKNNQISINYLSTYLIMID